MKYYCLSCNRLLKWQDYYKDRTGTPKCYLCHSKVLNEEDALTYLVNKLDSLEDDINTLSGTLERTRYQLDSQFQDIYELNKRLKENDK